MQSSSWKKRRAIFLRRRPRRRDKRQTCARRHPLQSRRRGVGARVGMCAVYRPRAPTKKHYPVTLIVGNPVLFSLWFLYGKVLVTYRTGKLDPLGMSRVTSGRQLASDQPGTQLLQIQQEKKHTNSHQTAPCIVSTSQKITWLYSRFAVSLIVCV